MSNQENIIKKGEDHIIHCYNRYPVVFDHGKGSWLYDTEGKPYLDFVAGISVNALGYADEGAKDVLADQYAKLHHVSNLYWTEPLVKAAEKLTKATGMDKVFFGNSGTEAVEGAIKLARMHQKENKGKDAVEIISIEDSFHGRTYVATTASGQDHFHENLEPLPGGFVYVPFNDIGAVKEKIGEKTAAVILEPIQGEGGIRPVDREYLEELRKVCDDTDTLLIFDEVQCGAGRTGKFLAAHNYGVMPDIVCMAKGIGAGFPIGAFLAKDEVAKSLKPGTHGSTYGGNALACAMCDYVLGITATDEFLNGVAESGDFLMEKLEGLKKQHPFKIKDVRGMGLIAGIEFQEGVDLSQIIDRAMDKGLLLVSGANNTIRIVPALNITHDELEQGVDILSEVLEEIH